MSAVPRDVHDGLVSTLMSTLVAAERGAIAPAQVLDALRDCVDDARIAIDSLEPIGHDVVVLLATVRHRLEHRLQAAGLNVRWEVQDLPLLTWLGPPQVLQVMRVVQEALTNVLKHSQARTVRISTRQATDVDGTPRVVIEIEDDGAQFDTGIGKLQARAQKLGARVVVVPGESGGTRVTLMLPLTSAQIS